MRSRWVRTPITFGKPWAWRMLRNSNVSYNNEAPLHRCRVDNELTISKPNDPSIMRRMRSATLPMSIMELRSLLHSIRVSRRLLPLTTVTGPLISFSVCLVYLRTRDLTRVLFPTPGGPTMATIIGGGMSLGVRSTRGTWRRVWSFSAARRPCLSALRPDLGANA
jgi:hypothetical protein